MRLETLGRSPGDVFASVWLQRQRELSCPNSVFWVPAYLPVPTPWIERTTHRRSSIAFLVLQALAAFHFLNLLSSFHKPFHDFLLTVSVVCFWMVGRKAAFFRSYHIRGICSPCATKLLSSPNYLSFLHFYLFCWVEILEGSMALWIQHSSETAGCNSKIQQR